MAISALIGLLMLYPPTTGDSVYGVVRDAVTGGPLPDVTIESGPSHQTLTDHAGGFVIQAPPPGPHRLRFTRAGFEPFGLDLTVPERRSLRLDVALAPLPVTLPSISVAIPPGGGPEIAGSDETEIGLRRYASETLRSNPLVSPDDPLLAATGDRIPDAQIGARRPFRARGGSSDQNLVLLDGLPVYAPAHLGGSAGPFDPDLLGRVDVHTAVPPAAYTGRLSSVFDVHLRPPNSGGPRVSGAWDQVAVRQSLNGQLGAAGALQVSLRRSYRGLFPGDVHDAEQNGFGDALVHASLVGSRDRLSVYVVDGSDNLGFPVLPHLADDQTGGRNGVAWSHRTAGLVWGHAIGTGHTVTARAWDARAEAEIGWGAGDARQTVGSALREQGLSVEVSPSDPDAPAILGISLSRPSTSYALASGASDRRGLAIAPPLRLSSAPMLAGVFGQARWRLGRRWIVAAGLRANAVDLSAVLLEPRVSTRLEVARSVFLLAGYGRIHQFVQSLRNEESLLDHAFGAELPLAVGAAGLQPARADQLSVALVAPLGTRSTLRLDAYARSLRHLLVVPAGTTGPFARAAVPSGSGNARGVELEIARRDHDLDLGLVLGSEAAERRVAGQSFTPGALRSRWLTAGAGYHLDDRTVVRFAGSVASGAATTPVAADLAWDAPGILSLGSEIAGTPETFGGAPNQDRLPAYWRVDAGLVRDWRVVALGLPGMLTTSITLSNLLNTRNPVGYVAGVAPGTRRALYFPSRTLGVQVGWRF